MRYRVLHRTTYAYTQPVSVCHHLLHLRPRTSATQRCDSTLLAVDPQPAVLTERRDYFGNSATFAIVQQVHRMLSVEAVSEVALTPPPAPDPEETTTWEGVRETLRAGRDAAMQERYYLTFDSPMIRATDVLRAYAAPSFPP